MWCGKVTVSSKMEDENRLITQQIKSRITEPQSLQSLSGTEVSRLPMSIRTEMLPRTLASYDPVYENRKTLVDMFASLTSPGSIFRDQSTLDIVKKVSEFVVNNNCITQIPITQSRTAVNEILYLHRTMVTSLSRQEALFMASWIIASQAFEGFTERMRQASMDTTIVLKVLFGVIYDVRDNGYMGSIIELRRILFQYMMDVYGNSVQTEIIPTLILLVTCYANMFDEPDRHVFTEECRCISCIFSAEYVATLNMPYIFPDVVHMPTEQMFFLFVPCRVDDAVNVFVASDFNMSTPIDIHPVLAYKEGGAVKITISSEYFDAIVACIDDIRKDSSESGTPDTLSAGIVFRIRDPRDAITRDRIINEVLSVTNEQPVFNEYTLCIVETVNIVTPTM